MNRNGTADRIRQYILLHGTATPALVAEAYGLSGQSVSDAMRKMRGDGRLVAVDIDRTPKGQPSLVCKLGRDPLPPSARASAGGKARMQQYAKQPKTAAKPRLEAPQTGLEAHETPKPAYQSSAEWEAAGGRIERLPATWVPPTKYPRPGFRGANL